MPDTKLDQGKLREWAKANADEDFALSERYLMIAGESLIRQCAEIARRGHIGGAMAADAILRYYGIPEGDGGSDD